MRCLYQKKRGEICKFQSNFNFPKTHPKIRDFFADWTNHQQQPTIDSDPSGVASNSVNPWTRLYPNIWTAKNKQKLFADQKNFVDMSRCVFGCVFFSLEDKVAHWNAIHVQWNRKITIKIMPKITVENSLSGADEPKIAKQKTCVKIMTIRKEIKRDLKTESKSIAKRKNRWCKHFSLLSLVL